MAQNISLTSGSILNGSPITLSVTPSLPGRTPAFHRIILEVECGMTGGNYEIIKLSQTVIAEGKAHTIDISSALRTFRDSYEYSPQPLTYPIVKFNVKAYDEWMFDGVVSTAGEVYYPQNPNLLPADRRDEAYQRTLFGSFSDIDRFNSSPIKTVKSLTRKPHTIHLAAVGETLAFTPAYTAEQTLGHTLVAPTSQVVSITTAGEQTIGEQHIFALPATALSERQTFRFINSFGVLESVSVPRAHNKKLAISSTPYVIALQETFNQFSRAAVRKSTHAETWQFQSDPLDEQWLSWYLHEFLMSEHVWIYINNHWVPVTVVSDDETVFYNRNTDDYYSVQFSVQFPINGNPNA